MGDDAVTAAKLADASVFPANLTSGLSGSSWAWATWTPTLSGNFTDGDWTKTGRYTKIGNTIIAQLKLIAADATPMGGGGGGAIFTLPVTSASTQYSANGSPIGASFLLDSGTQLASGFVRWISTTTAEINQATVSGSAVAVGQISSTVPFTWTTSDAILAYVMYEAA